MESVLLTFGSSSLVGRGHSPVLVLGLVSVGLSFSVDMVAGLFEVRLDGTVGPLLVTTGCRTIFVR